MTNSLKGRGNQYIQLVKVLYCKLPTNGKKVPSFTHRVWGLNHQPQRQETSMLHCTNMENCLQLNKIMFKIKEDWCFCGWYVLNVF